jgi:hypothetical protein
MPLVRQARGGVAPALKWLGDDYRVPGPPAEESGHEFGRDGLDSER